MCENFAVLKLVKYLQALKELQISKKHSSPFKYPLLGSNVSRGLGSSLPHAKLFVTSQRIPLPRRSFIDLFNTI